MANNSSLYGDNTNSQGASPSNYTTLYSGGTTPVPGGDNVVITGTLTVNGCSIFTDCSAFNLFPQNANTLNIGLESTTLALGATTGVTTVRNQLATADYSFPTADGSANQVLITNGAGVLSFANASSLPGIVTSITGTANQVIASSPTGAVTLSLPQSIATTSSPVFAGVTGGNVTVGIINDNTISTITGDLTIDSASDLVKVDATTFNVNSNNLFVNNNRVGINNNAPDFELHLDQGQDSLTQFGMTNNERTFIISNNGADDLLSLYYGVIPPAGDNRLQFNLTDQWFNTGKLGVGTATPAYELDVSGTGRFTSNLIATGGIQLNGSTSGYSNIIQPATAANIQYVLPNAQGGSSTVLTNDGSGNLSWALPGGGGSTFGNITIAVDTDNTISTTTGPLLLASATGDVSVSSKLGINTSTPGQELTISDGGDGYVQLGMINAERLWVVTNNAGDNIISYSVQETAGPVVNRLQFDATGGDQWFPSGRLGVGTATPAYELDVQGSGRFTNNIIAGTSLTLLGATSGYSNFAQPSVAANIGYTLPSAQGLANTVLTNDGSGALTWALPGGGGSTFGNITVGVVTDNTISTTTGDLVLASATTNIDASSAIINANGYTIDGRGTTDSSSTTTTSTATVTLNNTTRNGLKCLISVVDNVTSARHIVEALLLEQGTTAYITTYAEMYSSAALATFSAVISAGNLTLQATPASANSTTFTVIRTSIN